MNDERKDEVGELYNKCNNISSIANWLFIINIIISFILIFDFKYKYIFVIFSLILTIVYVVLSNINEIYFCNQAENERRRSLLKESFDINVTLSETNKYYNNHEQPSIEKLGLNCYESVFFTKNIVDKMILPSIIKISACLIIYLILMIKLENLDILLVITQTLFSTEILVSFIKLCYYKFQIDKIYKKFQDIFFILGSNNEKSEVLILDATMDYECLKSYCKIAISSRIFNNNNKNWSSDWDKLLNKYLTNRSLKK